jgi:hypothetical protein
MVLYNGAIEVDVPITEEYLIKLMYKNSLGMISVEECKYILEQEKISGKFDLETSIKCMLEA